MSVYCCGHYSHGRLCDECGRYPGPHSLTKRKIELIQSEIQEKEYEIETGSERDPLVIAVEIEELREELDTLKRSMR